MVDIKNIDNALTEGGNLKTQVHKNLKEQVGGLIESALGFEETPNGSYALPIASAGGKTIYARIDYVVTLADPFVEKAPAPRKRKETEDIPVPTLF